MRVVVLLKDAMVADVVCGREALYIGSREDCRVRLRDDRIAAQQAAIFPQQDGAWSVQALAEADRLELNGQPLSDAVSVSSGDELRVQEYVLRIYPEHEEGPAARVRLGTSQAQLERFARTKLPAGSTLKKLDEPLTLNPGQFMPVGRVAVSMSNATNIEQLSDTALAALIETFAAQRAWIGIRRASIGRMEYVAGRTLTGEPVERPDICDVLEPRVLDRAQFALVPRISASERESVMAGPLIGPNGSLGMIYIDSGDSGRCYEPQDLELFILAAYVIAHQLDAVFRNLAEARAILVEGQAGVAREIQGRLTPRKLPQWEQLQTGALREAGRERTGDIYDVVRLANNLAAFLLVQTPPSGALPSLLMTQALTAFRVAVMHQDTPAVFLRTLNWMLYDGRDDHPVDCFAGVIDPPTGQMRYAIAGDVGACIIGKRGEGRRLGSREALPALGQARSTVYPLLPEQLEPRETLALFSRGVNTATNKSGETFGRQRFINALCDGFGQSVSVIMHDVMTEMTNFAVGGAQPDDLTLVLAHRT